jgi:serine/threonine protein phosphatase PrpC
VRIAAYAGATDTGRKRRRNEDAYVLAPPLFAVADGMGGAQAGEVASRLAAAAVGDADTSALSGTKRLVELIQEANRRVYERSSADPSVSGMGTTMTVALAEGDRVSIGHVGDSRAYLVREGRMEQLTDDHSLVNELLKSGRLSPEEAETHPQRSVITRALGTDPEVDVDAFSIDAQAEDVFLICSDGLTAMVDDEDILELLEKHRGDLERAAKALVSAANRGGGEDNITVVAFRMGAGGDPGSGLAEGETMPMPAVTVAPEAPTLDDVRGGLEGDTMVIPAMVVAEPSPAGRAARSREPRDPSSRVRVALTVLVLLALAIVLLVWGLLR